MHFFEYGSSKNDKIILIHGFNIPYQMWNPQIEHFSKTYRVIVPALDGHCTKSKSIFSTVQKAALDIESYYIKKYGTEVFSICGMSMGGTIAAKLWENGKLHIKKLVLESAPLIPINPLLQFINIQQNLNMLHNLQHQNQKTLTICEKMYSKELLPDFLKLSTIMDDNTVKNCIHSFSHFCLPKNLQIKDTDIIFYHGTTFMEIAAKKSAKYLKKNYPRIKIKCFQGYHHCELSVNRPKQYIKEVEHFFANNVL